MADNVMQQSGPYIPNTDSGAWAFCNNFATQIAKNPFSFGVTEQDSQTISNVAADFNIKYLAVLNSTDRNSLTIEAKNASKAVAIETIRFFAQNIRNNLGVTNEQKLSLGLHLADTTRSPVPAPTTVPLLAVKSGEAGVHVLEYRDSATPESKAKPSGAAALQLFRIIGDVPNGDSNIAEFVGLYTRQPIEVAYGPENAGKTATYFAKWCNAKGETGEFGQPVALTIAFGGPISLQSAA